MGPEELTERVRRLRSRLLAANLRSRSLRLTRITRSGAFDLHRLDDAARRSLRAIQMGMGETDETKVDLVRVKGTKDELREISEDLRRLANAAHRTWMEVGERELLLGWPFVEAKLGDTWLRAPLLLYPATLERTRRGRMTWRLVLEGRPDLNEVLAQALFRFAGVRLSIERLVALDEDGLLKPDSPSWGALEAWLTESGLGLSSTGGPLPELTPLAARDREARAIFPEGRVDLLNHLILGRFPQSSSRVLSEYDALEERPELLGEGPAGELLAVDLDAGAQPARATLATGEEPGATAVPATTASGERPPMRILSSDASQEAVIRSLDVLAGRGVVVRGPPGTGKSQMIANLVGQAIDRGERLLVVCQKRAALDVVYQRLAASGLGEPLALVHDIHQDRAEFTAALAATLEGVIELPKGPDLDERVAREQRALAEYDAAERRVRARLEAGQRAYDQMMAPGPGGAPLAVLLERALDDDGRELPDLSAVAASVDENEVIRALPDIEAAAPEGSRFADPHPLAVRTDWGNYRQGDLDEGRARLEAFVEALRACHARDLPGATLTPGEARERQALWDEVAPVLGLFGADTSEDERHSLALYWTFSGVTARPDERGRYAQLQQLLKRGLAERSAVPPALFALSTQEVVEQTARLQDLADLCRRWWRVFVPRFWRLRSELRALPTAAEAAHSAAPGPSPGTALVPAPNLAAEVARAEAVCAEALAWHALVREINELLGDERFIAFGCTGQPAELQAALAEIETRQAWVDQLRRLRTVLGRENPGYAELPDFAASADYAALPLIRAALADSELARRLARADRAAKALRPYFRDDWVERQVAGAAAGHPDTTPAESLLAAWSDAPGAAESDRRLAAVPDWAREFLRFYDADGAEASAVSTGDGAAPVPASRRLGADLRLALERAWRLIGLGDRSAAQAEAALIDPGQREALRQCHEEQLRWAPDVVAARYWQRLRRAGADLEGNGRSLRKLLADARKKRYRLTIRQIVERYWSAGLDQARPIWLCSPESVAALFPLEAGLFDRVVMDEASQCPVEAALPALVRGKVLVVAGDEKQMPPSHFFSSRDDDDELLDDETADSALLSAQSILDVARVTYPGSMLRFHYRSRYEELITFSNHAFYGGGLVTAPPADVRRSPTDGMHFERVGGLWENQINEAEAHRVVDRVVALLSAPAGATPPTIGVVTFNQKQRALIEDLLDERAFSDTRAGELLAADRERPATETLFVKNLENVQGDERDIIVFSVGYGPGEAGRRIHARFGPLGVAGGENRLNVAITRAKRAVHVFASFAPHTLEVSGTTHVGPKLLKAYLEYAEKAAVGDAAGIERALASIAGVVEAPPRARSGAAPTSRVGLRVRDALATRLRAMGFEVALDHGLGPYRIDLAVRPAGQDQPWRLGVDCTRYLRVPDTLQRDVTEPSFWRRAGWEVRRVSPAMWLDGEDAVVSDLVAALGR
jgi:hypothetical protein